MVIVVSHGDGLEEALGLVVHATRPYRVDIAPVLFHLGMHEGVAVHFGGGSHQDAGTFFAGQAQAVVRAVCPHFEGLNRHHEVINRAGWRSKVQDVVEFSRNVNKLGHIMVVVLKILFFEQVLNIGQIARQEVVHANYLVSFGQEPVAEV